MKKLFQALFYLQNCIESRKEIIYNKKKIRSTKYMKWTFEQTKAIFEKENNILVAAAARKSEKRQF